MKKIKEFSKKYLIGSFISLIIFTVVGVKAATYFPSNQTTYDNENTGMKATNVQTAIDELYNTCFPLDPTITIGGQTVDVVTTGDGLYKDEYEAGRYLFKGANPNNYITFNNETWRIISIENDGTIKIMRNESIGNMVWDSSNSNNWARPASLNTYLNGTYLNGLTSTAQSQMVAKDWSIGAVTYNNNNMTTQVSNENSNKWNGKIALPTVSEYLRTNSDKNNCGTYSLMSAYFNSCVSTGWMDNNNYWWTLSPFSGSTISVFDVSSYGFVRNDYVYVDVGVRPSVYLSSEIQITRGNGSQSNPYQLSA